MIKYQQYTSGFIRMNDENNICWTDISEFSAARDDEWFHKTKEFRCSDTQLQIDLSTTQPEEVRSKFGYGLIQYHLKISKTPHPTHQYCSISIYSKAKLV